MIEASSGSILIDDIDISSIGLKSLRTALAIIPQDSVLFSGTIRSNLDPFSEYDDIDMWNALRNVNLHSTVSSFTKGLDSVVESGGENFSTGQRQLLCLARAMLKKPKILIMDEATANVDMKSDEMIQLCIRKDFIDSTIITIAHRLNTVIDYDKILVLHLGHVVEFDSPENLFKSNGHFAAMINSLGDIVSGNLRRLAKEKAKNGSIDIKDVLSKNC